MDTLIAQSTAEETDGYSEDSEEDEVSGRREGECTEMLQELESSSEWGWQLYWTVRSLPSKVDDEGAMSDPFAELPSRHYYPDYYDEVREGC